MSIYARAKAGIKISPNNTEHIALLKKALLKVAETIGARLVENTVVKGYNLRKNVQFLLEKRLPWGNGYGVEITSDGKVIVHADVHGAKYTVEDVSKMITREYVTEAVKKTAEEMNKNVHIERNKEENVVYIYEV